MHEVNVAWRSGSNEAAEPAQPNRPQGEGKGDAADRPGHRSPSPDDESTLPNLTPHREDEEGDDNAEEQRRSYDNPSHVSPQISCVIRE